MWLEGTQKRPTNNIRSNEELMGLKGFLEEKEAKIALYEFLKNNVTYATNLLMGIDLFPFQHIAIKTMMNTDYVVNVWGRGLSKCEKYDGLIYTDSGIKKIIDVEIGDKVQSLYGFNKVLGKTVNPIEKTYKATTQKGYFAEGLDYHRVLKLNEKLEFEWVFSKDLQKGDVLVMRRNIPFLSNADDLLDSFEIPQGFIGNSFNFKNVDINDWFYFFGVLIGDGHLLKKGGFSITSEDLEILNFIKLFCEKIKVNYLENTRIDNKATEIRVNYKAFSFLFEHLGFDISKKAAQKQIPQSLLKGSKEQICNLLRGLFDTDGFCSVQENPEKNAKSILIGFTSSSETLITQVQVLLLQLGIVSKRGVAFKGGKQKFGDKYYDCNKAESLAITSQANIKKFKENIRFSINRKQQKLDQIENYKYQNNEFSDYIPLLGDYLKKEFGTNSIRRKDLPRESNKFPFRKFTSRSKAAQISKYTKKETQQKIENLIDDNLFFDTVDRVEESEAVTVDICVDKEHCYVSNGIINHNTFSSGVYVGLDSILNQGVTTGILSASFRQSKRIFQTVEDIAAKPDAVLFDQCISNVKKGNDEWSMNIGKSKIHALPLGDGQKLRGFRFQRILIDEFLLMSEKIVNEIIMPFLSVVPNPTEREELFKLETKMIKQGEMKEEDRYVWPSNKLIVLSSASYKFEYLYKLYSQYEELIKDKKNKDTATRAILHFSYDCAPKQLYDQNMIQQAKGTMSQAQFDRELGAIFTDDSSGYFKIKQMKHCTVEEGDLPCVEVAGASEAKYIVSFDPSWSQTESSDDFAFTVLRLHEETQKKSMVHGYGIAGTPMKFHIRYFAYILQNFNVVAIVGDYNGGVQFMQACNESDFFVRNGIKLQTIDVDFDDPEKYHENLRNYKMQYNLKDSKIVILRKPTSKWIREANELLQGDINHKRIMFAASATDEEMHRQCAKKIPIDELKFLRTKEEEKWTSNQAKMLDFVEHQKDMVELTKSECALINITQTPQGTQTFDLPPNLRRSNSPDKARKDNYSSLVLGNWMAKIYFDANDDKIHTVMDTFTPQVIY